jgi:hypothetical protein
MRHFQQKQCHKLADYEDYSLHSESLASWTLPNFRYSKNCNTKRQQQKNSVAFSLRANYTDWATATCRRNLVPTFVDRGVSRGQRGGSPTAVNLFSRPEPLLFFQVAPHLFTFHKSCQSCTVSIGCGDRLDYSLNKTVTRRFGNWICFRIQVRGRRQLLCWALSKLLTSITVNRPACNNNNINCSLLEFGHHQVLCISGSAIDVFVIIMFSTALEAFPLFVLQALSL